VSFWKKTIPVTTAADGTFSTTVHARGVLLAVGLDIGDLSTPDLDVTDTFQANTALLSVNGVAADSRWQLGAKVQDSTGGDAVGGGGDVYASPIVMERVLVEIAGGGATKSGTVYLFMQR
jgi:hypothetical protein